MNERMFQYLTNGRVSNYRLRFAVCTLTTNLVACKRNYLHSRINESLPMRGHGNKANSRAKALGYWPTQPMYVNGIYSNKIIWVKCTGLNLSGKV